MSRTAMIARLAAATPAAAALALGAPAHAAPPWTAPQPVATTEMRAPQLGFGTGKGGVAVLRFGPAASRLLSFEAGAAQPATRSRDVGSVEAGPVPYAQTRTVSLRRRPTNVAGRFRLGYSFGRTDGAVGTMRALRTVTLRPGEAEIAASPNGNAVIAFAENRGGSTRVWLSLRRAGSSRFTKPRVVRSSGSARSLAVSVNDRGRWVLAYALGGGGRRVVEARIGTTSGRIGALQRAGTQLGRATVAAVVAPTGRATVAWTTHDLGEEQNDPTELRTTVAPAGRTTFAGQVVLDRAARGALFTEPAGPSLAAAPDGTTVVGYTLSGRYVQPGGAGTANVLTPARVSVQDDAARFTTPQELTPDGVVGQVAARADGTFAVPYVQGAPLEPADSPVLVALRGPGDAAFGAGELVAPDAGEASAAAFEPGASGAPVVLYVKGRAAGAALSRRAG